MNSPQKQNDSNAPHACARCESLFGQQRHSLKMWDGKRYCVACINAVSPELLAWAREHAYLEETLTLDAISRKKFYKNNFFYPLIGILVIFFPLGLFVVGFWNGFLLAMLPVAFLLPLYLLSLKLDAADKRAAEELPRTLVAQNNQLIVVHEQESHFYDLSELYYYESDTNRTVDNLYLENRPALILEKTPGWNWQRFEFEEIRYACGLTPEKRVLWNSFFQLIELPRKEMMSTRRYHLVTFLLVMTIVLAFLAIMVISYPAGLMLIALLMWILPLQALNTAKETFTKVVMVCGTLFTNGFVFYAFVSRNPMYAGLFCLAEMCLFLVAMFYIRNRLNQNPD
ncbi:hypothetical protein [Gimesia sp.]|uniref:hypothetical protein n=1 Tax=Gimesia sp. TaxID=2024833 RepID=UPI003A8FF0D4